MIIINLWIVAMSNLCSLNISIFMNFI